MYDATWKIFLFLLLHPVANENYVAIVALFSHWVMSNSLWPHVMQYSWLPCPSLFFWSLLKLMSIESVKLFNHLILCHPLQIIWNFQGASNIYYLLCSDSSTFLCGFILFVWYVSGYIKKSFSHLLFTEDFLLANCYSRRKSFLNNCKTKETISKVKRQPSEWKKIIANEATDN